MIHFMLLNFCFRNNYTEGTNSVDCKFKLKILARIILTFFTLLTLSLESQAASELTIDSDTLDVNQVSSHAIFQGNVVVNFNDMQLRTDLIEVFYIRDAKGRNSKIDKILIPGKLKAIKLCMDEVVIANKALYEVEHSKLTLTGDVILSKDGNIIKTSQAVYYTDLASKGQAGRMEKQNKR